MKKQTKTPTLYKYGEKGNGSAQAKSLEYWLLEIKAKTQGELVEGKCLAFRYIKKKNL